MPGSSETIRTNILSQLQAAGIDEPVARDSATIYAEAIKSLAKRAGRSADAMHAQYGPNIVNGAGQATEGSFYADDRTIVNRYGPSFSRDSKGSSPEMRTDSPMFKAWFGYSKVVDTDGNPLVVYHGTVSSFSVFDDLMLGRSTGHKSAKLGHFFSASSEVADAFSGEKWEGWPLKKTFANGANTVPAYLSITNPFEISAKEFLDRFVRGNESPSAFRKQLENRGFDGLRIRGDAAMADRMGGEEYAADAYVAFNPEQIKSAIGNNGSFDRDDTSILHQSSANALSQKGVNRRAPSTEAFREWNGRYVPSKAKGIFYHKTNRSFDAFHSDFRELGFHFGTLAQAEGMAILKDNPPGTNIMPVRISVRNPLRLKDEGSFHADAIADQLAKKGLISKILAKRISAEIDEDWRNRKHWDQDLRDVIQTAGYDGIVYKNAHEAKDQPSEDSWIVFEPTQIKSAIGNNGEYSRENPSILKQSVVDLSAKFKNWFEKSKVTDDAGNPLVVYHGTGASFNSFSKDSIGDVFGDDSVGFFFSNSPMVAEQYALHAAEKKDGLPNIIPAYLSVNNPYTFESYAYNYCYDKDSPTLADDITDGRLLIDWFDRNKDSIAKIAQEEGHDGMLFKRRDEVLAVAFSPSQIKSAIGNNGEYSCKNSNILKQVSGNGARGTISFGPRGRNGELSNVEITLLEQADASTFLHETAHLYLEMLIDISRAPSTSEQASVRQDLQILLDWFGVTSPDEITSEHHEQFARGSEAYLREGRAPSAALQPIFKRFSAWLKSIYTKAEDLNVTLSDPVRGVFDRVYASDRQIQNRKRAGQETPGASQVITANQPRIDRQRP